MMEEEHVPIIRVRAVESSETPSSPELIEQIKTFISSFLENGVISNISKHESLLRYLCLRGNISYMVQEITNIINTHTHKHLALAMENSASACQHIVSSHLEQHKKVMFLSEIFQGLLGRLQSNFIETTFLQTELEAICSNPSVLDSFTETFFKIVYDFRESGKPLGEQEISFIKMIQKVGLDQRLLGKYQLMTNTYYEEKREVILGQEKWILKVEEELNKERELRRVVGDEPNTVRVVQKELIKETLPELLGLVIKLVEQKDLEQLSLVWKYIKLVDQSESLEKIIQQSIEKEEDSLNKYGVERIILDKMQIMEICHRCFESDRQLVSRVELSFENIFSRESTLANQMMAHYLVKVLNQVNVSHDQYELLLEMFRTNPSKDFLMEEYKQLLSKHILIDNVPLTAHVSFVRSLSNFGGSMFTKSIETILNDVWTQDKPLVYTVGKLSCRVLNKHQWPRIEAPELILPHEMFTMREDFLDEYLRVKPNQQLQWIHWLSDLTLSIEGREIVVSQIQAAIIFFISRAIRPMKKHQLATAIQIDTLTLISQLQPLKTINLITQDRNQSLQICYQNILPYHNPKTYKDPVKTKNHIIMDRALTIQANIVRIMKKKRILEVPDIIKRVIEDIKRFKPTIEQINICLKSLDSREFIELQEGGIVKYRM